MGITDSSYFITEPAKVNIGSIIKLIGEHFVPLCHLEFFLNDIKIMDFCANNDGKISALVQIPNDIPIDRYTFIVKDDKKNERKISLWIGHHPNNS